MEINVDKIKRQTSGAMCVSAFALMISLVSIIFALETYILVKDGVCESR